MQGAYSRSSFLSWRTSACEREKWCLRRIVKNLRRKKRRSRRRRIQKDKVSERPVNEKMCLNHPPFAQVRSPIATPGLIDDPEVNSVEM